MDSRRQNDVWKKFVYTYMSDKALINELYKHILHVQSFQFEIL